MFFFINLIGASLETSLEIRLPLVRIGDVCHYTPLLTRLQCYEQETKSTFTSKQNFFIQHFQGSQWVNIGTIETQFNHKDGPYLSCESYNNHVRIRLVHINQETHRNKGIGTIAIKILFQFFSSFGPLSYVRNYTR